MQTKVHSIGVTLICLGLFCLISPGVEAQGLREFPPGIHWKQIETEHFIIIYDEEYQETAQKVATIADPIHDKVTGLLQYSPASKTYVMVTDHVDFINGYANPFPNNKIGLYLREPGAGDSLFGLRSPDWLSMVLTHEYTHIVQLDMVNGFNSYGRKLLGRIVLPNGGLPMWMIEGLAVYTETKWENGRGYHPYYAMMMRTEVLEDTFKPLDQMAAVGFRPWPMGTVYYLYGYFFMQYLADTYGEESVIELSLKNSEKPLIFGGNIFKKVYDGKNESKLWREWRDAMYERYESQIAEIRANPVTETRALSMSGYGTNSPIFSPDGEYVYYIEVGAHKTSALVQLRLSDGKLTRLTDGSFSGNFSISPDEQTIYFCQMDYYKAYSVYSDLYSLDIKRRKVRRLTKGLRAFEPAVSPDGRTLVFTITHDGSMNLMRMDLENQEITPILETSDHTQIAHPAFSSDGSQIAVQIWKQGGFQDIYVMNSDGSGMQALTCDRATDSSPTWGMQDEYIFFSSDRTGVANIFAYGLKDRMLYQITNVLTGVFDPAVAPDNSCLAVDYYSGNGLDIHFIDLEDQTAWVETPYTIEENPDSSIYAAKQNVASVERDYSGMASLLPKYWLPMWGEDEDGYQLGIMTSGQDVLGHHSYFIAGGYGLKSERFAGVVEYENRQFYPTVSLFGSDTATVFGDIFVDEEEKDKNYWQREQTLGLGISFPVYQTRKASVYFSTGYQYTEMSALTDLDSLTPRPDEGVLSGVSAGLLFENLDASIYAISPESGMGVSVTYRHDDKELGSDFTLDTVIGDARLYLEIPKLQHHVLAFRTVGGVSEGDTLEQGIFQVGGFDLDVDVATLGQQRFYLRGYDSNAFSGNRFALGSVEYRFPLWYPQRGFGTGWLFFDSIVGTAFYDGGNAWDGEADLDDFKHGVGGELRLNLGLQHGMIPLTLRLGYAKGLDEDLGKSQFIYGISFGLWL